MDLSKKEEKPRFEMNTQVKLQKEKELNELENLNESMDSRKKESPRKDKIDDRRERKKRGAGRDLTRCLRG